MLKVIKTDVVQSMKAFDLIQIYNSFPFFQLCLHSVKFFFHIFESFKHSFISGLVVVGSVGWVVGGLVGKWLVVGGFKKNIAISCLFLH